MPQPGGGSSRRGTRTFSPSAIGRCSMRAADLAGRRVAVWGLGREGRAVIGFQRRRLPGLPLVLLDEAAQAQPPPEIDNAACAFGDERIARALAEIDVIVKSPG